MNIAFMTAASIAMAIASVGQTARAAEVADLAKMGPRQQAHHVQLQAQRRAALPPYNYDIRPPVLKSIRIHAKVNAGKKDAQAIVTLRVNDNLSGVGQLTVNLSGPSGQSAYATWYSDFQTDRNELQLAVDMSNVSENGEWRATSASVSDANGNTSYYDEAALAALGPTHFTVLGATGDFVSPTPQAGGLNLTPVVSRSTPPRGMLPGSPARVGMRLHLTDSGGAGIRAAELELCHEDGYNCFYLDGHVSVRGESDVMLTLGGHVSNYDDVGTYRPYSLYVYDHAGNYSYYYRYYDDLDALFDDPVIAITE